MKILFIASCMLTLISGCAVRSTGLASYTDPDYINRTFTKIAVYANTSDFQMRLQAENAMIEQCNYDHIQAVGWWQIYPPTRDETDSARKAVLKNNNIDGFLKLDFGENGTNTIFQHETDYSYADMYGVPYGKFQATLIDCATGKKVWIAAESSEGGKYSGYDALTESFCEKVEEQLDESGLIKGATLHKYHSEFRNEHHP